MSNRPLRVLLVDDNEALRENLVECLESEGLVVSQASDGAEALGRLASEERPDVVVLDLVMPRLSGRELAAALRSSPELNGLRLVAMTGYRGELRDAEVDAVLEKPFGLSELLAEIEKARPSVAGN